MLKFYLRHLHRTLQKRPLRPLLLLLVVALSFAMMTVGFGVDTYLTEEERAETMQKFGTADLTLTPDVTAATRFLFEEEFRERFPSFDVTGAYPIPYFAGGEFGRGVAVNLETVGGVFDIRLAESAPIPTRDRSRAALVTRAFAQKERVGIGDETELSVFGRPATFRIYGISDEPFLGEYDLLTDRGALTRLIAADSVFVSVMGDSFRPAGVLYIDTGDGVTQDDLAKIRAAYPDRVVTTADQYTRAIGDESLAANIVMVVLIGTVTSAALIACCFYAVTSERAAEHELFLAVGFSRKTLRALGCAEMFCYWLIGCAIGILPAFLFGKVLLTETGCDHVRQILYPGACAMAAGILLPVSQLTAIVFGRNVGAAERPKRKTAILRQAIWMRGLPILTLLTLGVLFLVPVRMKFCVVLLLLLLAVATICLDVPPAFRRVVTRIGKRKGSRVSIHYAAKNAAAVFTLGNTARLLSVFLLSCFAMTFLIASSEKVAWESETLFCGDVFVTGGGAGCGEKLRCAEGEPTVASALLTRLGYGGEEMIAVSVSSKDCFSPEIPLDSLPGPGEFYVGVPTARQYGWKIGDTVTFRVGGEMRPLRLAATVRYNFPLLFDGESSGIGYDSYLVTRGADESDEEFYGNLTRAISTEIAAVIPVGTLMHGLTERVSLYTSGGKIFTVFLLAAAAIGIALNVADSYRSRREELRRFSECGMSAKDRRKMIGKELLYTALGGCAAAVGFFAVCLPGLYLAFQTFGIDFRFL